MTVKDISSLEGFRIICEGDMSKPVSKVFCCDLLSIAMSKAPAGSCWITIMGNINSLAVASLTDCSCIVFAEGVALDSTVIKKAEVENITLIGTDLPIFEAGLKIHNNL